MLVSISTSAQLRRLFFAFLALSAPNVIFFIAAHYFGFERAWFNLDYLPALVFWALRWSIAAWMLAFLAFFIDVLSAVSQTYLIFEPLQMLHMLRFVDKIRPEFAAQAFVFLLLTAGIFVIVQKLCKKSGWRWQLAALAPISLINMPFVIKEMQSGQINFHLDKRIVVLGSQSLNIYKNLFLSNIGHFVSHGLSQKGFSERKSSSAMRSAFPDKDLIPKRLLLVVVESWGVSQHPKEADALLRSLSVNPHTEIVRKGNIEFSGGTVAGELREMCDLHPKGVSFGTVEPNARCWPNLLSAQGYRTSYVHAASLFMYRRNEWLPTVGFKQIFGVDSVPAAQLRRCYSFPGRCDVEMFPFVKASILAEQKTFVQWMTLNSHLPYDQRDIQFEHLGVCESLNFQPGSARCRHFLLIKEFFDELAKTLADPELVGTEVVLVGDHAPPFFAESDRKAFSETRVPFLHLRVVSMKKN